MNFLQLKALMAALIAAGYRANPGDSDVMNGIDGPRSTIANWAARDAEAVLAAVLERSTTDDNQPVVYVEAQP